MTEANGVTLLKLRGVSKTYMSGPKRLHVLRQIDLDVYEGEFLAIVGRSGSGKTRQSGVARWGRARRVHLGRARPYFRR